jgi:hypothetical protein
MDLFVMLQKEMGKKLGFFLGFFLCDIMNIHINKFVHDA